MAGTSGTGQLTDLKAKMENYVQSTAIAAELAHQERGVNCQTKVRARLGSRTPCL